MAPDRTTFTAQIPPGEPVVDSQEVAPSAPIHGRTAWQDLVAALWNGGQPTTWPAEVGEMPLGRHDKAPLSQSELEGGTWQPRSSQRAENLLNSVHVGRRTADAAGTSVLTLAVLAAAVRVLGPATVAKLLQSTAARELSIALTGLTGSHILADGKRWGGSAWDGNLEAARDSSDATFSRLFPLSAAAARNAFARFLANASNVTDPTIINVPGRSLVPMTTVPATIGPILGPFGAWGPMAEAAARWFGAVSSAPHQPDRDLVPTQFWARNLSPTGGQSAGRRPISAPPVWDSSTDRELINAAIANRRQALRTLAERGWTLDLHEYSDPQRPSNKLTTVTLVSSDGQVLSRVAVHKNLFPSEKQSVLDAMQGLPADEQPRGAYAAIVLDQLGVLRFNENPWIARPRPLEDPWIARSSPRARATDLVNPVGPTAQPEINAEYRNFDGTVEAHVWLTPSGLIAGKLVSASGDISLPYPEFRFYPQNGVLQVPVISMEAPDRDRGASIDRIARAFELISYDLWAQGVRVIQTRRLQVGEQPEQAWQYVLSKPNELDQMVKSAGIPTRLSAFEITQPGKGFSDFSIGESGQVGGGIFSPVGAMVFEGNDHKFYSNGVLEIPSIITYAMTQRAVVATETEVVQTALEAINDQLWKTGVRVIQTPNFRFVGQPLKPWEYRLKPLAEAPVANVD